MALYDDEPAIEPVAEPKTEPKTEPKPKAEPTPAVEPKVTATAEPVTTPSISSITEPKQVLGEVIESKPTIADTIAPVTCVAQEQNVETLLGAISVADRFMLIRDLFNDDAALYERTIKELDSMDNLDDCIIYIAENFMWRPSADGTKLIMDLLQRKFR